MSRKRYEKREGYSDQSRPKIVQIGSVFKALEEFSHMQTEREQTIVVVEKVTR